MAIDITELKVALARLMADNASAAFANVAAYGSTGGAPTDAAYLTTIANASLSAEVVVGATPGGELGGTWAAPTVAAQHSGSAHHTAFVQADHDALANPHHSNANDHAASHTLASHSARAHSDLTGVGATDHHSNANDHAATNDPTADQKAALAGTSGVPSVTNKYVTDGDARNTNARTPSSTLTHANSHNAAGSDVLAIDAAAATGSLRTLGSGATQAAGGTDARLSDARTPTAHNQAESTITFTDITIGNFSSTVHGFVPKSGGGTTGFLRADGSFVAPIIKAQAVASVTGFAADTYLAGSGVTIPANAALAGSTYNLWFDVTKTGAGIAAPTIIVRFGTLGTTGDAALITHTFSAQTAWWTRVTLSCGLRSTASGRVQPPSSGRLPRYPTNWPSPASTPCSLPGCRYSRRSAPGLRPPRRRGSA